VDDIISGVAALEFGSTKQLSTTRLHTLLQLFDRVCTEDLITTLNVEQGQARRYLRACKLCITFMSHHLATPAMNGETLQ
jgi:hypothetical protein